MSIEKYLNNIEQKEIQPGPFSARLKYEMKEYFMNRRKSYLIPALGYALAMFFFVTTALLLFNPAIAQNVHYAFSDKNENIQQLDYPSPNKLTDDGFFYAKDLENLPAGKSYLIKTVEDKSGKMFYIDNSQNKKSPRIVY